MPDRAAPQAPRPAEHGLTLFRTRGMADYALLDTGGGAKLERFGPLTLIRPEEQATWSRRLDAGAWEAADAAFTGSVEEEGAGRWRRREGAPESWACRHGAVTMRCRLTAFRHVGVFPEQAAHWDYVEEEIAARGGGPHILNLFAYTGIASLIAAAAGARVTHVDASKKAIAWARENQALSGLGDRPLRWICEDATRFAAREARRGSLYDGILLDPPKFGRGPNGETWRLFENLPELLRLCRTILKPGGFVVLTAYAIRASALSLRELVADAMDAYLDCGELVLEDRAGRLLSTSLVCRGRLP